LTYRYKDTPLTLNTKEPPTTALRYICRIHTVYNWLNNARLDMIFFTAGTRPGLKR